MTQPVLTIGAIGPRLPLALLCGGIISLHRDLQHKGARPRTFGLVALATAGVTIGTITLLGSQADNFGRVVRGVLSGIGLPGGGVILRGTDKGRVSGLSAAAAIGLVAGLAMLCALGNLALVGLLLLLAMLLLVSGRAVVGFFGKARDEEHARGAGGTPPR